MEQRTDESVSLETQVFAQFDRLHSRDELSYRDSEETEYQQEPFNVYFRLSSNLQVKPYNPNDKSRKPGFLDDDPDFTLCEVAPKHKLIMNKFCWIRPQMILHTRQFESQTDLLTPEDFEAAWEVLRQLGTGYMVIFNGGPDAGSSVAHKHLQMWPKPDWAMFPDTVLQRNPDATSFDDAPFIHRFAAVSSESSPSSIYTHYAGFCKEMSVPSKYQAHNIILTDKWLFVVPRRAATIDGLCQGGANAMVGQLWLKSPQQLQCWKDLGPMNVLIRFGVPRDVN